jgi:hypothetical protein
VRRYFSAAHEAADEIVSRLETIVPAPHPLAAGWRRAEPLAS